MAMTLTIRRMTSRVGRAPRCAGQRVIMPWHWILYLAVSSLVTICLWTPAALRGSVSSLEWSFVAVLGLMYAMTYGRGRAPAEVARSGEGPNVKAVRP